MAATTTAGATPRTTSTSSAGPGRPDRDRASGSIAARRRRGPSGVPDRLGWPGDGTQQQEAPSSAMAAISSGSNGSGSRRATTSRCPPAAGLEREDDGGLDAVLAGVVQPAVGERLVGQGGTWTHLSRFAGGPHRSADGALEGHRRPQEEPQGAVALGVGVVHRGGRGRLGFGVHHHQRHHGTTQVTAQCRAPRIEVDRSPEQIGVICRFARSVRHRAEPRPATIGTRMRPGPAAPAPGRTPQRRSRRPVPGGEGSQTSPSRPVQAVSGISSHHWHHQSAPTRMRSLECQQ